MRTAAAAAGGLVSVSKAGVLRERAFILTKIEPKILLPRKVWKNAAQTLCVWGGWNKYKRKYAYKSNRCYAGRLHFCIGKIGNRKNWRLVWTEVLKYMILINQMGSVTLKNVWGTTKQWKWNRFPFLTTTPDWTPQLETDWIKIILQTGHRRQTVAAVWNRW